MAKLCSQGTYIFAQIKLLIEIWNLYGTYIAVALFHSAGYYTILLKFERHSFLRSIFT